MNHTSVFKRKNCRICKKTDLTKVLSFGPTPLANAFLNEEEKDKEEYYYPLDVYFCNNCSFLQLGHVVSPKILFSDYIYVSSTSPVFVNHFIDFANSIYKNFSLNNNSLVIDIGSNDGILLKPFKEKNVRIIGIEPAKKIAKQASLSGVPTISDFFKLSLAKKIIKKYGYAKVVTATNVFAHIDDLDEVLKGVNLLLEPNGVFIIEAPYLIDFIKKKYFDLVYHEHLSYWSLNPLTYLLSMYGFHIIDVEKVQVHGGSIRIYIAKKDSKHLVTKSVEKFLEQERKYKLHQIKTYLDFAKQVEQNKIDLIVMLSRIKASGRSLAGYGAPAKGNTLLNYFNIGNNILDFIVDDSLWKQGMYTPGKRIPVKSAMSLKKNKVDYLLILAWNFADSIMKNHQWFKKKGGKFIIPVPRPRIV